MHNGCEYGKKLQKSFAPESQPDHILTKAFMVLIVFRQHFPCDRIPLYFAISSQF
jgi:hypothetical protein